jgi:hypothetical protein
LVSCITSDGFSQNNSLITPLVFMFKDNSDEVIIVDKLNEIFSIVTMLSNRDIWFDYLTIFSFFYKKGGKLNLEVKLLNMIKKT